MRKVLPVDEVLKTIRECDANLEKLARAIGVVSPLDMDQLEALRDLRLRCADSIHTIQGWKQNR